MKIFDVRNDSNNIQSLSLVNQNQNSFSFSTFECEARANDWKELDVYIENPKIKAKNFYGFFLGTLVFDSKALEIFQTIFEMCGEILPLQVERGPKLFLLNILDCRNGLDYDTTKWAYYEDGSKGRIIKFGFHPERVINESSIFKIPEVAKTRIFTHSGKKNEEDEFYTLYHKHNLTGLTFEEVYSS